MCHARVGNNRTMPEWNDPDQTPSGVQPWQPPPGAQNPVPPASGDSIPAGHGGRLLTDTFGRRPDDGRPRTIWILLAVVVAAIFVTGSAESLYDEVSKLSSDAYDEIKHAVEDLERSIEEAAEENSAGN